MVFFYNGTSKFFYNSVCICNPLHHVAEHFLIAVDGLQELFWESARFFLGHVMVT